MSSISGITRWAGSLIVLAAVLAVPANAVAGFTALVAEQNSVFVQTTTQVKFVATLEADPTLLRNSVTLLKQVNGVFRVAGTMNDNGTGGDVVANDNRFTIVLPIQEQAVGELHFQASAAYRGVLRRARSTTFNLTIVPDVELSVVAGQEEFLVEVGHSWSTAFSLQALTRSGGGAHLDAVQSISPSVGLSVQSDLPAGGWSISGQSQAILVQDTFTASAVGEHEVRLIATLTASGQTLQREATIVVRVLPPGGVGFVTLSASPSGLQTNSETEVMFGLRYAGGVEVPTSVVIDEVASTGEVLRRVSEMRDDGEAPDLAPGDELYGAVSTLTAGSEPVVRYFQSTATFANGATVLSAIEPLPTVPYSIGFTAPDPSTLMTDMLSGTDLYCDQVLVVFNAGTSIEAIDSAASSVGGTVIGTEPLLNAYQLSIPCNGAEGVGAAINTLLQNPEVSSAEPNLEQASDEIVANDPHYLAGLVENGFTYDSQFQSGLRTVRADEAWVVSHGGPIIAVVDSGVNYNHEDLLGNVLVPNKCNSAPGTFQKLCPRLVSLPKVIRGRDFINNDSNPQDDQGHGSHVAGIAAANGNNGIGIAGIAWDSRILAIKSCAPKAGGSKCRFPSSTTASAILYAIPRAKIINMSFSGPSSAAGFCLFWCNGFRAAPPLQSNAVREAVRKGVLPVAAAGNEANGTLQYPCAFSSVLCVGSSTPSDGRASYSSYGAHVDIAAPGGFISLRHTGGYTYKQGTSMAAPLVAGVAALVWAREPALTVTQVRNRLIRTAVPLPGQQIGPRVDAFDAVFNGRFTDGLNAWKPQGTSSAIPQLGSISPTNGGRIGMLSTGPSGVVTESNMTQVIAVQPGTVDFDLAFDYAMLTEEYPEFVGIGYNDEMTVTLEGPCAPAMPLALETVDESPFTPIDGIDFPEGDSTVGWTLWKSFSVTVPLQNCILELSESPLVLRIDVRDRGDGDFDTNGIITNLRMR